MPLEDVYSLHFPRGSVLRLTGPHGEAPVAQGTGGNEGKIQGTAFMRVFMGMSRWARVTSLGLASLNSSGGLWGTGAVSPIVWSMALCGSGQGTLCGV